MTLLQARPSDYVWKYPSMFGFEVFELQNVLSSNGFGGIRDEIPLSLADVCNGYGKALDY